MVKLPIVGVGEPYCVEVHKLSRLISACLWLYNDFDRFSQDGLT
jgi:hypothetical protein